MAEQIDDWPSLALPWRALDLKLQPNDRAFALLDMAFAPNGWRRLQKIAPTSINLFDGCYHGPGLAELSPCLIELPLPQPDQLQTLWAGLLALSQGRPMLGVLLTQYSLAELAAHLRGQFDAVSADGQAFIVRLADSRILPQLLEVFDAAQCQRLLSGLRGWFHAGRDGHWNWVAGREHDKPDLQTTPYRLSTAQKQALQRLGLGDAILRYVQSKPSLSPAGLSPSHAYAEIAQVLTRLKQQGLDDEALAYRLCSKALR